VTGEIERRFQSWQNFGQSFQFREDFQTLCVIHETRDYTCQARHHEKIDISDPTGRADRVFLPGNQRSPHNVSLEITIRPLTIATPPETTQPGILV
jgi:hypothetical protein